jgi:hypothetical protein
MAATFWAGEKCLRRVSRQLMHNPAGKGVATVVEKPRPFRACHPFQGVLLASG